MDKIIDKVRKMMALANDAGASEGERDNALRMAYKLLAKYNLELADVEETSQEEARGLQSVVISSDTWGRSVSNAVASLFFCEYYFERMSAGRSIRHNFIGKTSNAITAAHMADYLLDSIKKQARKLYKSTTNPQGRSFCVGAALAITQRVAKLVQEDADVGVGTAVVLASYRKLEAEANEQWLAVHVGELKDVSTKLNTSDASAYFKGHAYGNTVSLANQITTAPGSSQKLLN